MVHKWMIKVGIQPGNLLPLGIVFFLIITWLYTTILLQQYKYPELLEHKVWRKLPILVTIVSLLSLVGFIILATMGSLLDWIDQAHWTIYILLTWALILYYFFIMSLVYMFSDNRKQVIHHTYAWSLGLLLVITFIF